VAKMPKNSLPAEAYAKPHTMSGKIITVPHTAGYPQTDLDCKPMKLGEKTAEKISHDTARGAGAAVKGVNFRTTL
jgi:hypothetical protein